MNVELTDPERKLLLRLLNTALGDVRSQVRRTRNPDWHDSLKGEESTLRELVGRLNVN